MANQEIYHVYNRSVGDLDVFSSHSKIQRILQLFFYYRYIQRLRFSHFNKLSWQTKEQYIYQFLSQTPLVEIYAYSLMPNHYHLLLKQLQDGGIIRFLSNCQNGFAKFFNLKKKRNGTLFLTSFKAVRITNEEQFIHVSRYIHLNPVTDYLIKTEELLKSLFTSFRWYMRDMTMDCFINTEKILSIFKSKQKYKKFVFNQIDYQRKLGRIKKFLLEKKIEKWC